MSIPEEKENEKGEEFKETIANNFPNLGSNWIHNSIKLRTPNCHNAKRPSLRHISIKLSKVNEKERNLKGKMILQRNPIRREKISHQKLHMTGEKIFSKH